MSHASLMDDLHKFVGKQIIDCFDDMKAITDKHGYSINVLDPEINRGSIDNEDGRLNVRTDKNSVVVSFSIG